MNVLPPAQMLPQAGFQTFWAMDKRNVFIQQHLAISFPSRWRTAASALRHFVTLLVFMMGQIVTARRSNGSVIRRKEKLIKRKFWTASDSPHRSPKLSRDDEGNGPFVLHACLTVRVVP